MSVTILNRGYHMIPPVCLANVVTCLEMTVRPDPRTTAGEGLRLDCFTGSLDDYLDLYRLVGRDWMWFSRLMMPRDKLQSIIGSPQVEVFVLRRTGQDAGLLELDFREA